MRFRPCIDLHQGVVKQIVGATLSNAPGRGPQTNFEGQKPARWYAELYRRDHLSGGHVIRLGPGNSAAAREALNAWPGGLQIGGGINAANARAWLDHGASAVIVTSWVLHDGDLDLGRLKQLSALVGRQRLVLDLSCRRRGAAYIVVTDRWQTFTRVPIETALLSRLARYCAEFLIHAVDVEGQCRGIERPLVELLGRWGEIPVTYAGGIHRPADIETIQTLGQGCLDFTVGSALDIFGGQGLRYQELAARYAATSSI